MASLLEYRAERGWSQAECARQLKIGLRSLRRYEAGQRPRPAAAVRIKRMTGGAVTFEPHQEAAE